MKKHVTSIFFVLSIFSFCILGCGKKEESSIVPEVIVEDLSENPIIEGIEPEDEIVKEVIEEAVEKPKETEVLENAEISYPYWWELFDYNANYEVLASDGEFKNLTVQPGNHPDELYITWFSKSSSKGKVVFELEAGEKFDCISAKATTQASISAPGYYRNSALIQGLESNQTYYYTIKNGNSQSPVYKYKTKDLTSTDFTFTIAGDPEIGLGDEEVLAGHRSVWRVVLNRMKAQIPDSSFLITMGDQVAKPSSSVQYDYFLDNSVLYSTPLVPVVGNHDVGTGFFGDHFSLPNQSDAGVMDGGDGNYWFTKGNVLFMVLNNLSPASRDTHETFVGDAIAQNPNAKWRIIISHYSPISMVERYQGAAESVRASYAYMAEIYDIDIFFGGHDHIYTRSYFIDQNRETISTELEYEFHNPSYPVYVIFNSSTTALLREPDQDYPWAAICVQNGVPQLTEVHVTANSIQVVTHDTDSWKIVDDFTIYKD